MIFNYQGLLGFFQYKSGRYLHCEIIILIITTTNMKMVSIVFLILVLAYPLKVQKGYCFPITEVSNEIAKLHNLLL